MFITAIIITLKTKEGQKMSAITYSNSKKACRVDTKRRRVEVVSKGFKVAVEFLSDSRVAVISFNQDGTIADKQYITAAA